MDTSDQIASENFNMFMRAMAKTANFAWREWRDHSKEWKRGVNNWVEAKRQSHLSHEEHVQNMALIRRNLEHGIEKMANQGLIHPDHASSMINTLDRYFTNYRSDFDFAEKMNFMQTIRNAVERGEKDVFQTFCEYADMMEETKVVVQDAELQREQYQEYEQSQEQNQQRDEQEQYNRENNAGGGARNMLNLNVNSRVRVSHSRTKNSIVQRIRNIRGPIPMIVKKLHMNRKNLCIM